jgi:ketosteroid isomerase-like protein
MEDVKKILIEKENAMALAFNKGQISKVIDFFDNNVIAFSSTRHERMGGIEEFVNTFHYYQKQAKTVEYYINSPLVQDFDDFAIVSFYWQVVQLTDTGRKEINGRGSHLYRKFGDDWKIVHEHFSRAHQE